MLDYERTKKNRLSQCSDYTFIRILGKVAINILTSFLCNLLFDNRTFDFHPLGVLGVFAFRAFRHPSLNFSFFRHVGQIVFVLSTSAGSLGA